MEKRKSIFGNAGSALMAAIVDFEGLNTRLPLYCEGLTEKTVGGSDSPEELNRERVLELQGQIEKAEAGIGKIKDFLKDCSSGSKKKKKRKTGRGPSYSGC